MYNRKAKIGTTWDCDPLIPYNKINGRYSVAVLDSALILI